MLKMSLKALKSEFRQELKEVSASKLGEFRDMRLELYTKQQALISVKDFPQWLFDMTWKNYQEQISAIDRKIYYWTEIAIKRRKEKLFDIPFIMANFKIEDYIEQKPNRSGNRLYYKCIFHNEKTPSMKVEGSRFYCFGCGKYGSVIDVVMHTYDMDFTEACKYLSNYGA